jgi:hypothetical protein
MLKGETPEIEKEEGSEVKDESDTENESEEEKGKEEEQVSKNGEDVSNEAPEKGEEEKTDLSFQSEFQNLEKYRKGEGNGDVEGNVSYFENKGKIILDGEFLVAALNNSFEETKKHFVKLSQTDSPKDQFFIKQEIIKYQENLRKAMLRSIRMIEKDNCSLPDFSMDILNVDVLKNVLEMVSMQNWSNQTDFAKFDNFIKSLKDSFYSRITPPVEYIKSIIKQLEIEEE